MDSRKNFIDKYIPKIEFFLNYQIIPNLESITRM